MSWEFFKPEEFACKHCGENKIQVGFVDKLDALRKTYGAPIVISSGYRCPEYNATVSSTGTNGPHTTGRAVDIAVSGAEAFKLMELALASGEFNGVGVNQKGNHAGRFIHLDDLDPASHPRPGVWSY